MRSTPSRSPIGTMGFCLSLLLILLLSAPPGFAQQNLDGLPRVSQQQTITQTLGVTEVTLHYHRPLVNGRQIWGALVPYDQVWRAGANENTTITFSDPVAIEGRPLAAGTYGLHMIPGEKSWQVIFSNNSTSWGSFSYDASEDALRVDVKVKKAPFQEELAYRFDHLTTDGGVVSLHWEELQVPFQVEVDTKSLTLAKIRRDLRSLPGFSWLGWNSAATYCAINDFNHEEALAWADRALSLEKNFSTLRIKSQLLRQTGKTEEADQLAEKSLSYANEAQTNALGYQFLQGGQAEKALEIFAKNVKDYPESWNVYDSLAEAQAQQGMTKEAIKNYTKALSMAPENQHGRIQAALDGLKGS